MVGPVSKLQSTFSLKFEIWPSELTDDISDEEDQSLTEDEENAEDESTSDNS